MADHDDAVLVDCEEFPDLSYEPRQVTPLSLKDGHVNPGGNFSLAGNSGDISSRQENSVPELIIAVFVVQFDTRRGKLIS